MKFNRIFDVDYFSFVLNFLKLDPSLLHNNTNNNDNNNNTENNNANANNSIISNDSTLKAIELGTLFFIKIVCHSGRENRAAIIQEFVKRLKIMYQNHIEVSYLLPYILSNIYIYPSYSILDVFISFSCSCFYNNRLVDGCSVLLPIVITIY